VRQEYEAKQGGTSCSEVQKPTLTLAGTVLPLCKRMKMKDSMAGNSVFGYTG
jgi:hypothetical protein